MTRALVIVRRGDPEIADAIISGIDAADAEADHTEWQRRVASLVRVAVGNTKTAEDYMIMISAAEQEYRVRSVMPLKRMAEALLGLYGLLIMAISAAYKAQDKALGER